MISVPSGGIGLPANVAMGAGFISFGPAPATSGVIRLGGAAVKEQITWSPDGIATRSLLATESGGQGHILGNQTDVFNVHGAALTFYSVGGLFLYAGAAQAIVSDGTLLSIGMPQVGIGQFGAVDGQAEQVVAGANIVLAADKYSRKILRLTGTPAAARTITYPHPASNDQSFERTVHVATTVSGCTISTGTGLTVAIPANDAPHDLIFTPAGVVRKT